MRKHRALPVFRAAPAIFLPSQHNFATLPVTLLLVALAVAPGLFLLYRYYRRDVLRPEPRSVITSIFFAGCLAVIPAGLLESFLITESNDTLFWALLNNFILIALVEETAKLAVLHRQSQSSGHYDEYFDGILYGAAAAAGFATLENIFYVVEHGFTVGIIRALLSVPSHVLEGAIIGYWHARSVIGRESRSLIWRGLAIAVFFHGLFDFALSWPPVVGFGFLVCILTVIVMAGMVRRYTADALARDHLHLKDILAPVPVLSQSAAVKPAAITWLARAFVLFLHLFAVTLHLSGGLLLLGFILNYTDNPQENPPGWMLIALLPITLGAALQIWAVKISKRGNHEPT